jgi:hypothetical protein
MWYTLFYVHNYEIKDSLHFCCRPMCFRSQFILRENAGAPLWAVEGVQTLRLSEPVKALAGVKRGLDACRKPILLPLLGCSLLMGLEQYVANLGLRRKVPGLYKRLNQVQSLIIIK